MSTDQLQRFLGDVNKPVVVIETSHANHQALLKVPKLCLPDKQHVANRESRMLSQRYGNPNLSGASHPHRVPVFKNRKPER